MSSGLGQELEGTLVGPNGPHHASELVGDSDGGLVVDVGLSEVVRPLAEPVGLLCAGVKQYRAGTVNEQCSEVAVSAL